MNGQMREVPRVSSIHAMGAPTVCQPMAKNSLPSRSSVSREGMDWLAGWLAS